MHMLWSVLQVTVTTILIFRGEYRDALETPPSDTKDEGIIALENFLVPSMFLKAATDQTSLRLLRSQAPNHQGHCGIERLDELRGDAVDPHAAVEPLTEALVPEAARLAIRSKLLAVAPQPCLLLALECLDVLALSLFVSRLARIVLLALVVVLIKLGLLRGLLPGVKLPKLRVGHALGCLIIAILDDFSIGAVFFSSFKVLKFVKGFFIIAWSSAPIASDKLITDAFNQTILPFLKPSIHVKRHSGVGIGYFSRRVFLAQLNTIKCRCLFTCFGIRRR
mmetsp:Transcript_13704/g.29759  ORF Transcript_13704/g.29759 Transcript_13704/m.29759 type:complete len:279 (-) Transcript_13704:1918-2754(-)